METTQSSVIGADDGRRLTESFAAHLRILDERLAKGLELAKLDGAVIFSGPTQVVHGDDIAYPFHVEPHFKAWVPLTAHPDCVLKLVPGRRPLLIYATSDDYWHAPAGRPAGFWAQHFDLLAAASPRAAMSALGESLDRYAGIGQCPAAHFDAEGSERLLRYLDFHRAFKTEYEVACLEEASRIAARGHLSAGRALEQSVSEYDLHQIFCVATRQRETELPYGAIVALNEHASILHYQNLDRSPLPVLRSFLLDAGVQVRGYAADVTRTHACQAGEFRELLAAMEALQQDLCARACSGVDFVELNETAHRLLASVLSRHALVACSAESAYEQGITRTFLPHGLGHLLGLQVHDAGGRQITAGGEIKPPPPEHPYLRLTRVLERNFVVTIEPGLYFIPMLLERLRSSRAGRDVRWDAVERMLPFGGIRIEDNVLIESTGARNLTRRAFESVAQDLTRAADSTS